MKLTVYVQKGIKFTDDINYAVIVNDDGQFAILDKHTDVTTVIREGYVKIVYQDSDKFIYLTHGLVTFSKHQLNIYALHAEIGDTFEAAKLLHSELIKLLDEQSKKENVDYSILEKDLREHIMKAKIGHI